MPNEEAIEKAKEVSQDFAVIENANPSAVEEAEGNAFKGDPIGGIIKDGGIKFKPNAKLPKRADEPKYSSSDNEPQQDINPFDIKIKEKNDLARSIIFPLLNPMSKSGGIRLNAIQLEIEKDLQAEEAKPEPSDKKIEQYKESLEQIQKKKDLGDRGREGIEFPPREEGVNKYLIQP